jgi:hypothetical protein
LLQPRIFSAAGFQDSTLPAGETATIPTGIASRISLKIVGSNLALVIIYDGAEVW